MPESRIFFVSDSHGNASVCRTIEKLADQRVVDAVVHAGDVSTFGEYYEKLFETVRDCELPIYFVSGNHETQRVCRKIRDEYGATWFDYQTAAFAEVQFVGIGAEDIFRPVREQNLAAFAAQDIPDCACRVLVTHEPPHPWAWEGRTVGSPVIEQYVEAVSFNLIVAGHYHEASVRWESHHGTTVLNPTGKGCLLRIDPAKKSFEPLPVET